MAKARSLPREPRDRYHFRTKHFEFFFEWAVGTAMHGGMATGESFHAACRMKDGDSESWVRAWREMGERVEKRADEALARGHAVTAREAYLRAYCHHRAATAFMDPFTDQRLQPYLARARACFRRAVSLMDGLLEPVEVPYQGTKLPGYFLKPDLSGDRRRTLLMIGGGDTYVEDLYYYIGPAGVKRGYNVLFVDLPGQGDLPFRGLYFPVEAEKPMAAVVDYALSRPEVDPAGLVAYGLSGGGYLVPRAACYEKRLKAIAVCSIILDLSPLFDSRLATFEKTLLFRIMKALHSHKLESFMRMARTYVWRWGATSLPDLIDKIRAYRIDPARIACPMLNLVAEQEYELLEPAKRWAEACLKQNPANRLIVAPWNEGADSHGVGSNLGLMAGAVFDWFDEILDDSGRKSQR